MRCNDAEINHELINTIRHIKPNVIDEKVYCLPLGIFSKDRYMHSEEDGGMVAERTMRFEKLL